MDKKGDLTKYEELSKERIKLIISQYCGGSQQKLADATGVNKASISQYVNGKNAPSTFSAEKLCKPFGINPVWLMGFDNSMFLPQTYGDDSGDMSEPRNLYYQELNGIIQRLSEDNLYRLIRYAEKLHDIQIAEDELK